MVIDNVLRSRRYVRSGHFAARRTSGKRSVSVSGPPDDRRNRRPGVSQVVGWFGVFTTARTPQPIVARLKAELNAIVKTRTCASACHNGRGAALGSPEDLRKHLAREVEVWGKVIREAGVRRSSRSNVGWGVNPPRPPHRERCVIDAPYEDLRIMTAT